MGLPLYRPAFEAALASCIGEEITQLHSEEEVEKYRAFIESADSLSLYDGRLSPSSWTRPTPSSPAARAPGRRQNSSRSA